MLGLDILSATLIKRKVKQNVKKLISGFLCSQAIRDIGKDKLPAGAKRALIIYNILAIPYFLSGKLEKFSAISSHSMYWETAEMVRLLNDFGFIVDFYDLKNPPPIDWQKYDLVIDERDNLKKAPPIPGQRRIFYSTGFHWLRHNLAELERIKWFYERQGIYVAPQRQINANFSDEHAEAMTFFGNEPQLIGYNQSVKKVPLNISAVGAPNDFSKNIGKSKNNFLWMGGGGAVHKGLDLTVEAFCRLPQANLYIAGDAADEPIFGEWLRKMIDKNPNIKYLGWLEVGTPRFEEIAGNCIASIYPSAAEGGPGSIAQLLHYGLIPIVTKTANVRAEHLGYIVSGTTSNEMIDAIVKNVETVLSLSEKELLDKSTAIIDFAKKYHTREAYSKSFVALLREVYK